jgi:MarR family transcriptional regulator for hemolysin
VVTLTEAGEAAFLRMRTAAMTFDATLRAGLSESDVATLGTLLSRLAANVGDPAGSADPAPPWAGLADR